MWLPRIVPGSIILRMSPELNYSSGSQHTGVKIIAPYSFDHSIRQLINSWQNMLASTSPKKNSLQKFISLKVFKKGKGKVITLSRGFWTQVHCIWSTQLPNYEIKHYGGCKCLHLAGRGLHALWRRQHMEGMRKVERTNQSWPDHSRLYPEPWWWKEPWIFMNDFLIQSGLVPSYSFQHLPHSHTTRFRK